MADRGIVVSDGKTFTPESWDAVMNNRQYSVVGVHSAWKFLWQKQQVEFIDGITILGDPSGGALGFRGEIHFEDGVYNLDDALKFK
jgi:hypothetical protein